MTFSKFKYKKQLIIVSLILISIIGIVFFTFTKSVELENDVQVAENSELIYYLEVTYDGVDRNGIKSDSSTFAKVYSDYILVEDKIPDGLTFNGFVESTSGTFGAVAQDDSSRSCRGYVFDDLNGDTRSGDINYNGLHYTEETRTVSFKVKNLQAGCKLTIGIKTTTPSLGENKRLDFYNFATAQENGIIKKSNIVHVFMGEDTGALQEVIYKYADNTPDGAPELPSGLKYKEGSTVGVISNPKMEGYKFLSWETEDATVINGEFKMPSKTVTFVGTFEKMNSYDVSYQIGEVQPEGYEVPEAKKYYPDTTVSVDSLKVGDIINGYRFLGWKTNDVVLSSDNDFIMPESNVLLTGEFEQVKYEVEYRFYEGENVVLPPNSASLLPAKQEYLPGESVTLADPGLAEGYEFVGWNREKTFTMSEENVVVYGEWKELSGVFRPKISFQEWPCEKTAIVCGLKALSNKPGSSAKYRLEISNPESFAIKNVQVKIKNNHLKLEDAYKAYSKTDDIIEISEIGAKETIDIFLDYVLTMNDYDLVDERGAVVNEVELVGAVTSNKYELDMSEEAIATYKVSDYTVLSPILIIENKTDSSLIKDFDYKITRSTEDVTDTDSGIRDMDIPGGTTRNVNRAADDAAGVSQKFIYESGAALESNTVEKRYVNKGLYKIMETIPQEYTLDSVELTVRGNTTVLENGEEFEIDYGKIYTVTFNNRYKKKGYYHSDGRVENVVERDILVYTTISSNPPDTGDGIPDKYQVEVTYEGENGYVRATGTTSGESYSKVVTLKDDTGSLVESATITPGVDGIDLVPLNDTFKFLGWGYALNPEESIQVHGGDKITYTAIFAGNLTIDMVVAKYDKTIEDFVPVSDIDGMYTDEIFKITISVDNLIMLDLSSLKVVSILPDELSVAEDSFLINRENSNLSSGRSINVLFDNVKANEKISITFNVIFTGSVGTQISLMAVPEYIIDSKYFTERN